MSARRERRALFALLACLGAAPACREPAGYPARPVTLIVPWAAGGGSDRVARHLAVLLERELGQPVSVVNVTGGAGATGHSRGARARPDGYTLTLMTVELNLLHHRGLTPVTHRDFEPIAMINRDAAALLVRADAPWRTLGELEAAVRAAPGTLRASGTARGGIWHLALAAWLAEAALAPGDVPWVPVAGAAPALAQLLAGGLEIVACSLPEARTLLEAGRVRALGVMADERVPGFAAVPTLREQGRPLTLSAWRGLGAPRGLPPEVRQRLVDAAARVVGAPEYTGFLAAQGFAPAAMLSEGFARELDALDVRMGELLDAAGLRRAGEAGTGPYVFPAIVAGVLVLALGGLGGARWRAHARRGRAARHAAGAVNEAGADTAGGDRGATEVATAASATAAPGWPDRALDVLAAIALHLLASEAAGYLLSAAATLLWLALRLGARPRQAALAAIVVVPLTYQVFAGLLRVPLPRGVLGW